MAADVYMNCSNTSCCKNKFFANLELAGNWCAVATAFAIPISTSLVDILFIVTPLLVMLSGNWQRKFDMIFRNPVAIMFLGFFALFVIGLFYTTAPLGYALNHLMKYGKFALAVFFLPVFTDAKWRNYAIYAFLLAIGIMLAMSYLRYFDLISYVSRRPDDPVEVFKGHIAFSFLLSFAAYLLMQQIFMSKSKLPKLLYGIFFALLFYNVFFLGIGRAGYFIFTGLVMLFFVQKLNWKGILLAILALVILSGAVFSFSTMFQERIAEIKSDVQTYALNPNIETSIGLRLSFVKNAMRLVQAHPIIGTGTGSVKTEYANILPTPFFLTDNPHNEYLNIAVQLGAVGLLFLLMIFTMQLIYTKKLPFAMNDLAQATVISIMLGCLANSWLLDVTQGHFYVYFSMLAFAALKNKNHIMVQVDGKIS